MKRDVPSEPLAVAVRYYDNHADDRFVEEPEVPIDNSPTEREFQNVAKLRLNTLFGHGAPRPSFADRYPHLSARHPAMAPPGAHIPSSHSTR